MFERLDDNGDRKLGPDEFKKAVPLLNKWGLRVTDAEETFRTIDKDNTGGILFDEFCIFAASHNLDLDTDDDFQISDEDILLINKADIKTKYKPTKSGTSDKPAVEKKETSVDWAALGQKLPIGRSAEDKAKRKKLFRAIDGNGNGYLSLAELDNGVRDVLQCHEIFEAKPAINRAFHAARNAVESKRGNSQIYTNLMTQSLKDGKIKEVNKQGDD
jgi:Ca2+-binding EF-hand superfamily protein